jgi:hypothetical protein
LIAVAAIGGWMLWRYSLQKMSDRAARAAERGQKIEVPTPAGTLSINPKVKENDVDLPFYPGAMPTDEPGSGTVDMDFPVGPQILAAEIRLETSDSLDKVAAFYRKALRESGESFSEDANTEKVVLVTESMPIRMIEIRAGSGRTRIKLTRLLIGQPETP